MIIDSEEWVLFDESEKALFKVLAIKYKIKLTIRKEVKHGRI